MTKPSKKKCTTKRPNFAKIGFDAWQDHCWRHYGYKAHPFDWEHAPKVYITCSEVVAWAIEKAVTRYINTQRKRKSLHTRISNI